MNDFKEYCINKIDDFTNRYRNIMNHDEFEQTLIYKKELSDIWNMFELLIESYELCFKNNIPELNDLIKKSDELIANKKVIDNLKDILLNAKDVFKEYNGFEIDSKDIDTKEQYKLITRVEIIFKNIKLTTLNNMLVKSKIKEIKKIKERIDTKVIYGESNYDLFKCLLLRMIKGFESGILEIRENFIMEY